MPARRKGVEVGNSLEGGLVVVLVADNHLAEADFLGVFLCDNIFCLNVNCFELFLGRPLFL